MTDEHDPIKTWQYLQITEALSRGDARMQALEQAIESNTRATQRIDKNTADLVDAWQSMRGAMKVFETLASLAKPVLYLAALIAAAGAVWSKLKGGN